MLKEVAPNTDMGMDDNVHFALLRMIDDFVVHATEAAGMLAHHRGAKHIEMPDLLLALEHEFGMSVPGFSMAKKPRTA